MTIDKWDIRFMYLARFWANLCSKDPSTKVGAVLVGKDRRDVALGYNGFPPGIDDSESRLADREYKHRLTLHAERNVIDNAHFDTAGSTLYCTQIPCTIHGCSLSVVSRGIKRVVCPPPPDKEPWLSDATASRAILEEGGVELVFMPADSERG